MMKSARAAVAVAAVLAVAGCATPSGSTAFSVDGNQVSERTVSDTAAACAPIVGRSAQDLRPAVVDLLLRGSLAKAISQRSGVEVTPAMRSEVLAQSQSQAMFANATCGSLLNGAADFVALSQKLGDQRMSQELRKVDVVSNPSYGNFDAGQASLDGSSGSLSREDLGVGKVFG